MSISTAAIDLSNAMKNVRLAWEEAREGWKDSVARDFEANQYDRLEGRVRGVLSAVDRIAPILAKALRDCS